MPRSQQASAPQCCSTFDGSYRPPRRSSRLSSEDYYDDTYDRNYDYRHAGRQLPLRQQQGGGRRSTLAKRFAPPNPLPQYADPEQRAYRKKKEKETGGFTWEEGITLALTAAAAAFSVDKRLRKANEETPTKRTGGSGGGDGRHSKLGPRDRHPRGERTKGSGSDGAARWQAPVSSGAPKEDWYYGDIPGGGTTDRDRRRSSDAEGGRACERRGTW